MLKEKRQQKLMKERTHYVVDTVFPFVTAFTYRSFGFVERCELTRMKCFHSEMCNEALFNHESGFQVKDEVVRLRTEISQFKIGEKMCATHCSFDLLTLRFHFLNSLLGDLERIVSLPSTSAARFEHFSVLIKQTYNMKSWRLLTRLQ